MGNVIGTCAPTSSQGENGSTRKTESEKGIMKKFITMGALALALAAVTSAPAPAWLNWKFGVGVNLGWQSGGNNTLWGLFRNGQPPAPDCGPGPGCALPPGGPGYGMAPFGPASIDNHGARDAADQNLGRQSSYQQLHRGPITVTTRLATGTTTPATTITTTTTMPRAITAASLVVINRPDFMSGLLSQ